MRSFAVVYGLIESAIKYAMPVTKGDVFEKALERGMRTKDGGPPPPGREFLLERDNKLKLLASELKKILPPHLLQELIDQYDPLGALFLRDGVGIASHAYPRTPETESAVNLKVCAIRTCASDLRPRAVA
jgi:hypothetical protein